MVKGSVLISGEGSGPLLRLGHPISFWGGVDPRTGLICDPRHPDYGVCITGTVLALPSAVGSSSSSWKLPNYTDKQYARTIFRELRSLPTRYEPFVGWTRLPFEGETTTVNGS